uniref:Translocation protein SEC62 n=1 Tax=Setaria digitata TaxID=48799 RepID=A0A915PW63_9BILA
MADRRKGGRKKTSDPNQKLTKEEDTIARYVRFNCPTKTTMFEGNEVHYFTGTKAVDILYESKKYGHAAKNVKFATRQAAVVFMRSLLEKGLFFRARKLVPKKKDDKKDLKEKVPGDVSKSPKKKSPKIDHAEKEKEKSKEENKGESDDNDEENGKEKDKKKDEEEKKRRKIKLELHLEQSFNDANDVYVWIFDPTPLFKKIIGALMVLGTIAGCLFPLWPMWLRQGVYYLSVGGLACFGVLIGVAVARTLLFAVIWAVTMGRHKLWLLPNLTEDCGFFESFQPWYTYEYCSGGIAASGKKKKKREWKKKSDDEEPLLDKREMESDGRTNQATEAEKRVNEEEQLRKKESDDGNGDFSNGNGNDETDEEADSTSDSDGRSSQETGGSLNNSGDTGSGGNGSDDHKIRLRRRARKADDDFVLIDK